MKIPYPPVPSYVIGNASATSHPCAISAVGEFQHVAVGFSDLAAQDESNAATAVLGGEEWNKKNGAWFRRQGRAHGCVS